MILTKIIHYAKWKDYNMISIFKVYILLTFMCCVQGLYAVEPLVLEVSSSASWAWFDSVGSSDELGVLVAETEVLEPEVYAVNREGNEVSGSIALSAAFGSEQAKKDIQQFFRKVDETGGLIVQLSRHRVSLENKDIRSEKLPVYLPCLHPNPDQQYVAGSTLVTQPYWKESQLVLCGDDAYLLSSNDDKMYLSSKPSEEKKEKYKPKYNDLSFPKMITNGQLLKGENTFVVLSDAPQVGEDPNFPDSLISPELFVDINYADIPGTNQVLFFDAGRYLCASQDSDFKWKKRSSDDGKTWAYNCDLPLDKQMQPVAMTESYLVGIRENKKGFSLQAWVLKDNSEYEQVFSYVEDECFFIDVELTNETELITVLIGKPGLSPFKTSVYIRVDKVKKKVSE